MSVVRVVPLQSTPRYPAQAPDLLAAWSVAPPRAAFPDLALQGSGDGGADRGVAGAECGAVGADLHQPDAARGFERPR